MGPVRAPRYPALVVLVGLLLGCAGTPDNEIAPGHEGAPGVHRFLVCAPNTALALPAELGDGAAALRAGIEEYLLQHDREVEWVDLYQGKHLLRRALDRAKEEGRADEAPALFAEELSQHFDFQVLVMPSILVQRVRTRNSWASWDGVKRRMRTLNAPRGPSGRGQSTLAEGVAHGGISGDMLVTSVHVVIFSPEGEKIFEGRGGLEFLHDIDLSAVDKSSTFELSMRDDLFTERELLQEGIGIAFTPYLPPRGR
jgi:hypothetical protein